VKKRRGFTLIEILVSISIISILAAMLLPVLARSREKARRAHCMSNLRSIGQAISAYSNDWEENYPTLVGTATPTFTPAPASGDGARSLGLLYKMYVDDSAVFICPSAPPLVNPKDPVKGVTPSVGNVSGMVSDQCSFGYDPTHRQGHSSEIGLAADAPGGGPSNASDNHFREGQNVLQNFGGVKWMTETNVGYMGDEIYDAGGPGDGTQNSYIIK